MEEEGVSPPESVGRQDVSLSMEEGLGRPYFSLMRPATGPPLPIPRPTANQFMLGRNDRGNSSGKDVLNVAAMPWVRLRSRIVNMSETMMLEPQNAVHVSTRHNVDGRDSENGGPSSSRYTTSSNTSDLHPQTLSTRKAIFAGRKARTNRQIIKLVILVDIPLPSVPIIVSSIATWFAPRRPRTLHKRPYRGVNVDVARRYPVASNDAWFADPKSEEMETMSVATAVVFTACVYEHRSKGQ